MRRKSIAEITREPWWTRFKQWVSRTRCRLFGHAPPMRKMWDFVCPRCYACWPTGDKQPTLQVIINKRYKP